MARFIEEEIKKVDFGGQVKINFNENGLSDSQRNGNVLAKVTIDHLCFKTKGTIFRTKSGIFLGGSGFKGANDKWFSYVQFTDEFSAWLLDRYLQQKAGEALEPYYLGQIGKHSYEVTTAVKNDSLGILDVIIPKNIRMTDKQASSGFVSKISVETSIATLRQISIFESKIDRKSIYAVEPTESYKPDDGSREIRTPAFALSILGETQILNHVHSKLNFDADGEPALDDIYASLLPGYKERKNTSAPTRTDETLPVDNTEETTVPVDLESLVYSK